MALVESSAGGACRSAGPVPHRPALDWPLSHEEKRSCALKLYEQDVKAANYMIRSRETELHDVRRELKELRRQSLRSSTSSTDLSRGAGDAGHARSLSCACNADTEASRAKPTPTAAHAALKASLRRFYAHLQDGRTDMEVEGLARRWAGEGAPELWAMIATKYQLPPQRAVWWLADSIASAALVQWPKGKVPQAAREVVAGLALQVAEGSRDVASPRAEALRAALQGGSLDAVRAIAFHGCPGRALRPHLWRTLLGVHGPLLVELREAYRSLRAEGAGAQKDACEATRLRAEVEAEAKAAWRGEAFLAEPGVADAVVAVAYTNALQHGCHIPGSCELATLLLYAIAPRDASGNHLEEAEADTFHCLTRLLEETGGSIADDAGVQAQALRVHALLRRYDPPLVELLTSLGLGMLPATRLGVALCTRAGFALEDCAQMWDPLLADPGRFDFCDHLVVALLLLSRRELLSRQGDAGAVAEALLAAPRKVVTGTLLRVAHAVCAFERRCGAGCSVHFPPPPTAGRSFWPAAIVVGGGASASARQGAEEPQLSVLFPPIRQASWGGLQAVSLWGKIREHGAGAWNAGRRTMAEAFPQQHAPAVAPSDAEEPATVPGALASAAAVEVGLI